MNETLVRKYAYLLAKVGINVQAGQKVMVEAMPDGYQFIPYFAEECYKLGASEVIVHYLDLALLNTRARYEPLENVRKIEDWKRQSYETYLKQGCAVVRLEGVNTKLMENTPEAQANAIFAFIDNLRNIARAYSMQQQWLIAMVPTQAWAEVIFPNEPKDKVLDMLWDTLFRLCYITEDNDIEAVWKEKKKQTRLRGQKMDALHLRKLHYTASNGTDLIVGLTENSRYSYTPKEKRIEFTANIPTEEICTTPDKYATNGVVYASRPLVLGGKKIENFGFRFEKGKVVEVLADKGKEMLESLVHTDEGACYLGESALVEYDSPISQSGLVYYTTLIDENASCHLALGRGLSAADPEHFNHSQIHIDFMIGTRDMNIAGTDVNGKEIQIFKDGNFAF